MTFDEFITKYDGKEVDWDGHWGAQCVDLYRQYCHEVLDVPQSPPVIGAYAIWNTITDEHFEKIANTPSGIPEKGDIMLWNKKYGPYGHVGIYMEGDVYKFYSFDQNDPLGSPCHKQRHNYRGVIGWLRLKKEESSQEGNNKEIIEEIRGLLDKIT